MSAAAVAAALQMDGTTAGLTRAVNAATNLAAGWNFDSATLTTPTVDFGATTSGTWYTAANVPDPTIINYARVTKTVAPTMYFIPVVVPSPVFTQNVQSQAIAGQVAFSANTSIPAGLGPFTGVAACSGTVTACEASSSSNFGLTVGSEYDIQWPQYNGNRGQCKSGTIADCFVQPPCPGDTNLNTNGGAGNPMQEIVSNWGSSINGYWGSNSTSQLNNATFT